jgi:hypothetical protein
MPGSASATPTPAAAQSMYWSVNYKSLHLIGIDAANTVRNIVQVTLRLIYNTLAPQQHPPTHAHPRTIKTSF